MTSGAALATFKASLAHDEPPEGACAALGALWHAARGDWARAHELAQVDRSADGAWVHAYLHRLEGDLANARYWYGQAGKPFCEQTLTIEWDAISTSLLGSVVRRE